MKGFAIIGLLAFLAATALVFWVDNTQTQVNTFSLHDEQQMQIKKFIIAREQPQFSLLHKMLSHNAKPKGVLVKLSEEEELFLEHPWIERGTFVFTDSKDVDSGVRVILSKRKRPLSHVYQFELRTNEKRSVRELSTDHVSDRMKLAKWLKRAVELAAVN